MATKKDLLVLLLDVGEHMQPYLPLLHRMAFNALNCKLLSKPNHEVAVVLYGTKDTRHKLYDPADPLSYHHVSVLRPLQNVGSYLDLEPFAIASDPPRSGGDGGEDGTAGDGAAGAVSGLGLALDAGEQAEAEAAVLARVESAGLVCRDAAALCGRAARLFGPPGPKCDWADGLVVALDLLASSLAERFDTDKKEAAKLGQLRVLLVSNLLGQSEPFDDDFRSNLAETCTNRRILLEVACLDHFAPPPPPPPAPGDAAAAASAAAPVDGDAAGGLVPAARGRGPTVPPGVDPLTLLPAELAAARRHNLEQLHLLKAELAPAAFRHLRQPAELLCLFRAKEVAYQASNAVFMLTPKPSDEEDPAGLPEPIAINVKLYKKIRRTIVDEWKTTLDARPGAAAAGVAGPTAPAAGGGGDDGDGGAGGGGGGGGAPDMGFVREVEYEDPTTGQKFTREDYVVKGYSYGKQAVPIAQYNDEYADLVDEQMRKFKEKDFSLLGFIDAASVARYRLIDEPQVVLGDSATSAVAIASLALVLKESNRAGVVRFLIRKEQPQLGLLTPHLSDTPDVPHALLLSPLPFAEDIRTYVFSTFRNEQEARDLPRQLAEARGEAPPPEPAAAPTRAPQGASAGGGGGGGGSGAASQLEGAGGGLSQLNALLGKTAPEPGMRYEKLQPDEQQQAAALELVRALDLGPSPLPGAGAGAGSGPRGEPYPEALPPETTANPVLQRAYMLVTSRALDPGAQLPDPEDDPLVELELLPHGRYWPTGAGSAEAVRRAEEKLRTRERADGGAGPAAKRARGEEAGVADAAGNGGAAAAAAPAEAVVFDPSAAGGTAAARVTRVAELTAVEDFRAMLRQGRESALDAIQQLQDLVRDLVGKSIGDQLYGRAIECAAALREGCAATGGAGTFNRFLRDLAEWCTSAERVAFTSEMAGRGLTLITAEDLDRYRSLPPPAGSGSGFGSVAGSGDGGGGGGAGAGGAEQLFQDDGGAASDLEARRFLQQHSGPAEAEVEATLPAVVQDEEFEDMD